VTAYTSSSSVAGSPYASSCSGAAAANYSFSYTPGTVTVGRRPIIIKAADLTKVYGNTLTFNGTEFTIVAPTSLAPGDSVTVTLTSAGAAASATVAGSPYVITPSAAVFSSGPATNYSITYQTGLLTVTAREGRVAYIGQTIFYSSGSSSTTAQATLTASVSDVDGSGLVANALVTFTDILTGKVLASGVKVSPVANSDGSTGTANTIVTLSTGQYGATEYLIEVRLTGNYTNSQQLPPAALPGSTAYAAAHPTVTAMIPATANSIQGGSPVPRLATAAGKYGDASSVSYGIGMKYNNKGTSPQGQVQLVLERADGTYYVKSNSITSLGFAPVPTGSTTAKDVTIYTKASIYKVLNGVLTSVDGNVTLRVDAHEGCLNAPCASTSGDTIGFTVLSSKDSALYYSNNWAYASDTRSWRTIQQAVNGPAGVVIN